jgi:hypothetical protein
METMTLKERNVVKAYSILLDNLNTVCKAALVKHLSKSLNKERKTKDIEYSFNDFIPEKSAEEIIAELRDSRSFGRTRIIEPL